jgi:RsiW-degrading membrane proteinase PrsW (M82 family)
VEQLLVLASIPAAVLPVLGFLAVIWWLDRFDREPVWLLLLAFGWGAAVAVPAALWAEQQLAATLSPLVLAPLCEEPAKAVAVLLVAATRHFDNTTDGFVYGAAVGLGFGMTENAMYFAEEARTGSLLGWAWLVAVRSLYASLMHAAATSALGAALGFSKFRSPRTALAAIPAGALAMLGIHGLWNGLLQAGSAGAAGLGLLDLVLFPLELAILGALFALSLLDERRILQRELAAEAEAGVLPVEHVPVLSSLAARLRDDWLPAGVDHDDYLAAATTLAFRKHQLRARPGRTEFEDDVRRCRQQLREANAA